MPDLYLPASPRPKPDEQKPMVTIDWISLPDPAPAGWIDALAYLLDLGCTVHPTIGVQGCVDISGPVNARAVGIAAMVEISSDTKAWRAGTDPNPTA